jgi:hypothetical protein
MLTDTTLEALATDAPPESKYLSVVATCWLTPIRCLACGTVRENAETSFIVTKRSDRQQVLLQSHDPVAFLAQHPDAIRTVEVREEELIPFCQCARPK